MHCKLRRRGLKIADLCGRILLDDAVSVAKPPPPPKH